MVSHINPKNWWNYLRNYQLTCYHWLNFRLNHSWLATSNQRTDGIIYGITCWYEISNKLLIVPFIVTHIRQKNWCNYLRNYLWVCYRWSNFRLYHLWLHWLATSNQRIDGITYGISCWYEISALPWDRLTWITGERMGEEASTFFSLLFPFPSGNKIIRSQRFLVLDGQGFISCFLSGKMVFKYLQTKIYQHWGFVHFFTSKS